MKKTVIVAAMAALLAGCTTSAPPAKPAGPKLDYPVNSPQRLRACAKEYDASSKQFADCWGGKAYTRNELCVNGSNLLDNRYLSDWKKAQLYEIMRNKGCMGG